MKSDTWQQRLQRAQSALDQKTKPPGSLGELEAIAAQLSAIQDTLQPCADRARAIIFAADHGVAAEGVSAFPQAVTRQMLQNFAAGGAAINALCEAASIDLQVVDMGINGEPVERIIDRRVAPGTANLANQPAMTQSQYAQSVEAGRQLAIAAAADDINLLAIGEMGIANTTSAAALVASLCNADPAQVTGRGTGIDDSRLSNKVAVVKTALARHAEILPQHAMSCVGGFEIAAMAGVMIEALNHRLTIVVDGYIATAAALWAVRTEPACRQHLMFAHQSAEAGHGIALQQLQAKPILQLNLRLGEGSGAALCLPIIRAAAAILNEMATFEDAGVSRESTS